MTRRGNGDGDYEGITLGRRDLLRGGAAVGTFALASRIEAFRLVMQAQAQANEPRLQLGPDYFFDDDDDELVISHDTEGDIFRYDPTSNTITALKPLGTDLGLSSNDITDVGALTTEQAQIGTVSGEGDVFRLTERQTPASDTGTIQFTGLSIDTEYRVFYSTLVETTGSIVMLRMNGDGASTGDYFYWDASGTKQPSQNEFLLATLGNSADFTGVLLINNDRFGESSRTGINHDFLPGGPVARITDFGREGGRDNGADGLSSIELIAADDFSGGVTVAELWERNYA